MDEMIIKQTRCKWDVRVDLQPSAENDTFECGGLIPTCFSLRRIPERRISEGPQSNSTQVHHRGFPNQRQCKFFH